MASAECGFSSTASVNGQQLLLTLGPTLVVDIGFDASYKPGSPAAPIPGLRGVTALVDTGATECCIDNILASQLMLPVVDRRRIAGISGRHEVNVYLAQIHVPTFPVTIYGAFCGVHLAAGGQYHKALIGRSFLQHFTMLYEGPTGSVVISWPRATAFPAVSP